MRDPEGSAQLDALGKEKCRMETPEKVSRLRTTVGR